MFSETHIYVLGEKVVGFCRPQPIVAPIRVRENRHGKRCQISSPYHWFHAYMFLISLFLYKKDSRLYYFLMTQALTPLIVCFCTDSPSPPSLSSSVRIT